MGSEHRAGGWLTTAEAAARLGVRPSTLYAYVSRGLLRSHRTAGSRESRYEAAEIERLAARARTGGRAGGLELVVDTALTLLDPAGALYYRGLDATHLCRTAAFEDVAEWLWTGGWPRSPGPWPVDAAARAVAEQAAAIPPLPARPVDRLVAAVAVLAPVDPLRHDRRAEAVAACARQLITTLVECLPAEAAAETPLLELAGGASRPGTVAARLWPKLCAARPQPPQLAALNAALVLLADHELAASTLAARVAASTWADPYHVVLAGLGALDGPLHGRASEDVAHLLADAEEHGPAEAVGARLRVGDYVPGFGHKVYAAGDPRAATLFDLVTQAWPASPVVGRAAHVRELVTGRGGPLPNVDFALATLVAAAGMTAGAGEAIFAVARIAGWVAHAIEEYPHRNRFRPRAVYVGQPPAEPLSATKLERVPE